MAATQASSRAASA
uniref:Uncharacterized protein n=1 Tax=Arundo donax TaxID=35708 RepID=A0A0A9C5S6_ARUDO